MPLTNLAIAPGSLLVKPSGDPLNDLNEKTKSKVAFIFLVEHYLPILGFTSSE
jgi:hypothetical protein